MVETCAYCAKQFDPESQSPFSEFNCSYHPKRARRIGDTGPRGDAAELWVFPCCGKSHVGEIVGGSDVAPRQSPGCINCFHSTNRSTVFISYSRTDQAFVDFLESELRRRGYAVWKDTSDLVASENWQQAINTALELCTHSVLVVSAISVTRPEVNRELGAAAQARIPIIPVLIDDCELPAWIRSLNYIDWRTGRDFAYSDNFTKLEHALADPTRLRFLDRTRLARPAAAEPPDGA
jgi:hypothetical protein